MDKYGSREAILQSADLADSINYDFAHGDDLIDEVLRERAAAQNPLLQTNQAALAREAREVRRAYRHDEVRADAANAKQYADNEYSGTRSDTVATTDNSDSVYQLGTLSSKYESLKNPAAIGKDNAGGYSYGSYQIATNTGTMENYKNSYLKR